MASSLSRAEHLLGKGETDPALQDVVNLFCQQAKGRITANFKKVSCNTNRLSGKVSEELLTGKFDWMMTGILKP